MSKSKNNLANYHSESISKSDVSEDYEQLVKYKNLDLGKIIDWSEILNDLRRDCFMIDKSRQVNFINQFFSKSFIGNVTLCKIGEKWPIHNGEHLLPIFQLYIKDLPLIPRILSDIEYLMIFIHKEGYDASNKDSICIRSYNSNDKLVRIDRPHNIISKSYKIKLRKTNDWPSDDIPEELIDYLNNEYYDKALDNPYQCKMGNKVGGWPSWVEFSEMCKNEQFILQLDNYGEPFWDVTDCPTLYIFRNNKTNEFSASVQI